MIGELTRLREEFPNSKWIDETILFLNRNACVRSMDRPSALKITELDAIRVQRDTKIILPNFEYEEANLTNSPKKELSKDKYLTNLANLKLSTQELEILGKSTKNVDLKKMMGLAFEQNKSSSIISNYQQIKKNPSKGTIIKLDNKVVDKYMASFKENSTRGKRASVVQTGESLKKRFVIPKSSALGDVWASKDNNIRGS